MTHNVRVRWVTASGFQWDLASFLPGCSILGGIMLTLGFPDGSSGKESACSAGEAGDAGSIFGLRRFPGEGHGQPTPVFLPGEIYGQESLAGYSPWGHRVGHD